MNNIKACGNQNGCVTGMTHQDASEFSVNIRSGDGLASRCKSCQRAEYQENKGYRAEQYKSNRAEKLAYQNEYHSQNSIEINARKRAARACGKMELKDFIVNNSATPQVVTQEDWSVYRQEFKAGGLSAHQIAEITDWSLTTVESRVKS